jgi:hypothetical protein
MRQMEQSEKDSYDMLRYDSIDQHITNIAIFYHGSPSSFPWQFIWDMWWKERH